MGKQTVDIVKELAAPILTDLQLELVDIEFKKEGPNWYLRLYIDSDEGVDLDDCSDVSERLSEKLDEHDPIAQAYFLEVSSPGAERPLKNKQDVQKAIGKNIYVTTYVHIEGEKAFEGILESFDGEQLEMSVKVKARTKTYVIPYDKVAKARLAVVF